MMEVLPLHAKWSRTLAQHFGKPEGILIASTYTVTSILFCLLGVYFVQFPDGWKFLSWNFMNICCALPSSQLNATLKLTQPYLCVCMCLCVSMRVRACACCVCVLCFVFVCARLCVRVCIRLLNTLVNDIWSSYSAGYEGQCDQLCDRG